MWNDQKLKRNIFYEKIYKPKLNSQSIVIRELHGSVFFFFFRSIQKWNMHVTHYAEENVKEV